MFLKFILSLLKIGTFGYGGGAAALPMLKEEFVVKSKIITEDEFIDILGTCNVLPGPLLTKFVSVLGYKLKGWLGSFLAICAIILPSGIMMLIILYFFKDSSGNEKFNNMLNAITPVIVVIMTLLTWDCLKSAKSKFDNKTLIPLLILFTLLLMKIPVVFLILGVLILSFALPKKEGE